MLPSPTIKACGAGGKRWNLASDLTVDQPPAEYFAEPVQDYERDLAARSRGLVTGPLRNLGDRILRI